MTLVTESIGLFLPARRTPHNADLVGLWHPGMETQVNADPPGWPIRIPKRADTEPVWRDYTLSWPLDLHAEAIGMTGWNWEERRSLFVGFDFDAIAGHKNGLTPEQLAGVRVDVEKKCPYVEVRRSTGGKGIHLYVHLDAIPTANHTEHAALAGAVLKKMADDTGRDLTAEVDCYGAVLWCWHRQMAPNAYEVLKPSTQVLSAADLPPWEAPPPRIQESGDQWDQLAEPYLQISLDDQHKCILEAQAERGWPCEFVPEQGCYRLHTGGLAQVHKELGLRGIFSTSSPCTDKSTANCFAFVKPNGAFLVKRFGCPSETAGWEVDDNGQPSCMFNAPQESKSESKPRLIPYEELDSTDYQLSFLIDGVLAANQAGILAGPPKALKTTSAIDLAISLATGTPFLDRFPVKRPVKVAMFCGEGGLGAYQNTARRIHKSKGLQPRDLRNLSVTAWIPRLTSEKHLDTLERLVQGFEVMILDPLYMMMPGAKAENLMVQGERLYRLNQLCLRCPITPILLHHTRKRGKGDKSFDPLTLPDIAWAGFGEFARQWYLICPRERREPGASLKRMWLTIGGSVGHESLWGVDVDEGVYPDRYWDVELKTPSEARAEKGLLGAREKIINAIRAFPDGNSKTAILQTANVKNNSVTSGLWDSLVGEGVLVACDLPGHRGTKKGFKLGAVK